MHRVLSAAIIFIVIASGHIGRSSAQPQRRAAPTPAASLLVADGQHLADVRTRLSTDASVKPALQALEEDANKALGLKPMSVMDKGVTPPSGDKHDYMSQAPYWWPDPAKPNGLPYIRRDGDRNPEINKITDRDNLGRVCNSIWTLGLAFYFTERDQYAAQAARLARAWFLDSATRMNPHLKFGQGIPGINDGRGIGIIETRDLVPMLDGIRLISGSPHWTAADEAGLQSWMRAYLSWLIDSPHGKDESRNGNNHETWYDVQVAGLALSTGQKALAASTLEGSRNRIGRQFEPDGRQPRELERTRSWDYSEFNLRAFFDLADIGRRHANVDLWSHRTADGRSLRQGLDYMVQFASGSKKWPYEQMGGVRPGVIHRLLRRAAVAWKDPTYGALAAKVGGGDSRLALLVP
jgi:Alginate lyase